MVNFKKEVSVIIPAYNEEKNIKKLIEKLGMSLKTNLFKYEIIVIDDNSQDNTYKIAQSLKRTFNVKTVKKHGKKGKAFSIDEGAHLAKYSNIGFIDADLQYPPEALPGMVLMLAESDVVVAERKKYNEGILRKALSRGFRKVFGKTLFGLPHDIQSGLKVFKKEVFEAIDFVPRSPWTYDLEFLYRASQAGFKIANYNITFKKRVKGDSKVGIFKTSLELGTGAISLRLTPNSPLSFRKNKKNMRGAGVRHKKKQYVTHTTLPVTNSSIITFTRNQKFLIALILELSLLGFVINPVIAVSFVVAVLSFIYFSDTLFNLFVVLRSLHVPQEIVIGKTELSKLENKDLPVYTILCPLYKESHIIPQFLKNIDKLSYPKSKLDVILLLEEDDKESVESVKKIKLPSYVRSIVVPDSQPKTKPKACNYGLSYAKGEFLVIYDAEDQPERDQLLKSVVAFKKLPEDIKCLQAKLNYYNPSQNLLTRFFTAEYSLWFDVTLTGYQSIGTTIPLGGTSNHFRTNDLKALQGWDPFNVTEDADLGVRLFKNGFKTAIIDSVTLEEANSRWGNWLRQRSRWIKGYMQTYLVHTRSAFSFAKSKKKHFPLFNLIVGGKIAFILINPFLWLATISYFTMYHFVGPAIEKLYPAPVFYMAAFSTVIGNFLFMYYYMIGVMKRHEYGLIKYVFLIPFYWLMISIAGFIALYQLIFKPFYWEKTVHGLTSAKKPAKLPSISIEPVFLPRPSFNFSKAVSIAAMPFEVIGNAEKAVLLLTANTLIFVGLIERKTLSAVAKGIKKGIVSPLRYAMSIFF